MDLRMNAGYIITDSIHVGNTEFVLGVSSSTPTIYVTWECKNNNNYFWGHYTENCLEAKKDLLKRAGHELEIQERLNTPAKVKNEKERER